MPRVGVGGVPRAPPVGLNTNNTNNNTNTNTTNNNNNNNNTNDNTTNNNNNNNNTNDNTTNNNNRPTLHERPLIRFRLLICTHDASRHTPVMGGASYVQRG